jgi:hypothetical protein
MVSCDVPPATTVRRHRGPRSRTGRITPGGIPVDQVALPVTMFVLGVLAGTVASRSLRRRSVVARVPMPIEAEASARLAVTQRTLDETTARLHVVTEQRDETRAGLAEAQAEVLRLSGSAKAMTDRAEAEMGRMESAAIAALESAATSNRQEVAELRHSLATAEDAARVLRNEFDAERRRSASLQSALADRDIQLANLRVSARDTRGHRSG